MTQKILTTARAIHLIRRSPGPVYVTPMGCDMEVRAVKADLLEMMGAYRDPSDSWLLTPGEGGSLNVDYNANHSYGAPEA